MTIRDHFLQPCNGWFQTGFSCLAKAAPFPSAGPCTAGLCLLVGKGDLLQQPLEFKKKKITNWWFFELDEGQETEQLGLGCPRISVLGTGRLDTGANPRWAVKGPVHPSLLVAVTISVAVLLVSFSFLFFLP